MGGSSIPISQHLPATTPEENTVAEVGYLVRIISYSEESCQIEIMATGERKFLPTKVVYHPSPTNHVNCGLACPCQQDSWDTLSDCDMEEGLKQEAESAVRFPPSHVIRSQSGALSNRLRIHRGHSMASDLMDLEFRCHP